MASRNIKRGSNAIIYAVFAVGIVVLLNVIASRYFTRFDLTEDKIFTLSPASKELVASLPDRLTIKAFISSDLPPQVRNISRYLRDMLEEYATHSNGKVHWEALDPTGDEEIKKEAQRLKVHQARLSVFEKSKASVTESYLGVAFQYGGKVEAIPFVSDIKTLEYQISSTIRRLTTKPKKVAFTSGHGEPSTVQGLKKATEALKDYDVITIDLTEGNKPVPDDVDVLVMVGPTSKIADRAKYELDQFLMRGKAIAMFLDGMTLQTPKGQFMPNQAPPRIAQANVIGLREQLEYYGAKLHKDLVMDRQNQRVVLPAGGGQRVVTNYPAFPIVTNLARDIPITRHMKAFVPVFPSSVEPVGPAAGEDSAIEATVLARSTDASWRQTGFFLFNAMQQPQPTKEIGPFPLALLLQGPFKSFYAGKPVPAPGPAQPPEENAPKPSGDGQSAPATTRLVVVADADLIKDQFLGLYPANLLLLQNVVDYLAQDESLISIRAKAQTRRPLQQLEDSTIAAAKWANVIGVPLAFVLIGLVRWRLVRRARRRRARAVVERD
jgi:gliding-associated putative ABC transporter substrate-binding component GldG